MDADTIKSKNGVVTFIDVIGWRGIHNVRSDAIEALRSIVNSTKEFNDLLGEADIRVISDTLVFASSEDKKPNYGWLVQEHAYLASNVINEALKKNLLVRGAISCGKYKQNGNIFAGVAIDEAAAWHEQTDWVGVHLTPSAEFQFLNYKEELEGEKQKILTPYQVPLKQALKSTIHCVNWIDEKYSIKELRNTFLSMGPILPEVASKYFNTLKFAQDMIDLRKKSK